jgi:hypothetical protein
LAATVAAAIADGTVAGTTFFFVNGTCGHDAWSGTSPVCAPPDGPKATIQAAIDGASGGDFILVAPGTYPEMIDFGGKAVTLRSTAGPELTTIDAQGAGTVVTCASGEGPDTLLEGFTITGGDASLGGGMHNVGSSPTVRDCIFTGNLGDVGAAMRNRSGSSPLIEGCSFIDNTARAAGGGMINGEGRPVIRDCLFRDNTGSMGYGAVGNLDDSGGSPTIHNCRFIRNYGGWTGGAATDAGNSTWVNCVFSRNVTEGPAERGTLTTINGPTVINCTFSRNAGHGIATGDRNNGLTVVNAILWGNTEEAIYDLYEPTAVSFSDVEGGWSGPGNINADPLFVQSGTDNVRLSFGSPCVNAGDNGAIPVWVDTDLDGNPRIIDGIVDMGAYEGEHDLMPPAEGNSDFDRGDVVSLIPTGGDPSPVASAQVAIVNLDGPDNASVLATEHSSDLHPDAGGFTEVACIMDLDTSLDDGQFFENVNIPFDEGDLEGADPLAVNVTYFDPVVGNWGLAVAGNTQNSAGHAGPIGNRIVVESTGDDWGITGVPGDYGVYWNPAERRGFAWANLDHAADFAVGQALCPADCRQTPDGDVGVGDLLAVLYAWGDTGGGPCDIDANGIVGVMDLVAVMDGWGPCPQAARVQRPAAGRAPALNSGSAPGRIKVEAANEAGPPGAGPAVSLTPGDLDGNKVVDRHDLAILQAAWGSCGDGHRADLDRDGRVGVEDMMRLLARWGSADAVSGK